MAERSGTPAGRRRRRRAAAGITLALAGLLVGGCAAESGSAGSGGTPSGTPTSGARPDEQTRKAISDGLTRAGEQEDARLVLLDGSRLTPVQAPFLKSWRVYRVEYRRGPHPVMRHVAYGGGQAWSLTGAPDAFGKVTAADGTTVADPATAAALARLYIETTRPGGKLTYVVGGVEEIRFRPGITGKDARRRDEIVEEYRSAVKAPAAVASGDGFTATVFVVKDRELQRHEVHVSGKGAVRDQVRTLESDLPVPYAI